MSKENVTDYSKYTENKFLTISDDGVIDIPLTIDKLERLEIQSRSDRTDDYVPEWHLILLAREIAILRGENQELSRLAAATAQLIRCEFNRERLEKFMGVTASMGMDVVEEICKFLEKQT